MRCVVLCYHVSVTWYHAFPLRTGTHAVPVRTLLLDYGQLRVIRRVTWTGLTSTCGSCSFDTLFCCMCAHVCEHVAEGGAVRYTYTYIHTRTPHTPAATRIPVTQRTLEIKLVTVTSADGIRRGKGCGTKRVALLCRAHHNCTQRAVYVCRIAVQYIRIMCCSVHCCVVLSAAALRHCKVTAEGGP